MIIIKIFYEHLEFISWKHITDLLNVDISKKIILLKRNNLDTYNSLVKARWCIICYYRECLHTGIRKPLQAEAAEAAQIATRVYA